MKSIIFFLLLGLMACNQTTDQLRDLQVQIDSLENRLADTYKPGFGEFMSGIQAHHVKLWFAGKNENWALADFEIHEIMEAVQDIQKYQKDRKESELIEMINSPLDSVNLAITQKSPVLFERAFTLLTNTCNNCHRDVDFDFNVVKIPDSQPFPNQVFKVSK